MVTNALLYLNAVTYLDSSMVRNSITPYAATQRLAVEWLRNYFDVYGDDSPNSESILVQIMLKGDLYQHYLRDMKGQPIVSEPRFGKLWNVYFHIVNVDHILGNVMYATKLISRDELLQTDTTLEC